MKVSDSKSPFSSNQTFIYKRKPQSFPQGCPTWADVSLTGKTSDQITVTRGYNSKTNQETAECMAPEHQTQHVSDYHLPLEGRKVVREDTT